MRRNKTGSLRRFTLETSLRTTPRASTYSPSASRIGMMEEPITLSDTLKLLISEAAQLLSLSDDTVWRWINRGLLPVDRNQRPMLIDGAALASVAHDQVHPAPDPTPTRRSARNRFVGLVTNVESATVMTQVELQCGPHRVVSLMSSEAARELNLVPGCPAIAVVKSTQVIVEIPKTAGDSLNSDP
jgi:molybdopterin-binding protein